MGKIFFKAFFSLTIAFILFINMVYAFDMVQVIGYYQGLSPMYDYSNYYFGFHNFLDFIDDFDNSNFISTLKRANTTYIYILDDTSGYVFQLYAGSLPNLFNDAGFLETLGAIASHLTLLVLGLIYPLWFLVYHLCVVGYIVINFFTNLFGYYTPLPTIYPV